MSVKVRLKDRCKRCRVTLLPEILRLREAGYSYQDIADKLGFSAMPIWKWVKEYEAELQHAKKT